MKRDRSLYVIAALLAVIVVANITTVGVQLALATSKQAAYDEHAQQLQARLARQQRLLDGIADSYHADAYDSGVDRIAEQQLIAAEYQILLLQTIAQQNAQMIELMVVRP